MFYYIARFLVNIALSIYFSIRVEGKNNIPDSEQVIYASNHRTNADPPLLAMRARGRVTFMAKEELFRNKAFGLLISSLGAFPVSRGKGDTGVLDTAVERLNNGRNLMIFPEGTRSKDGKVHRGHSGAAVISARSGKRIIPVGIVFGEKLSFRTRITIKFGEPIDPKEYVDSSEEPNPRQLVKLKKRYMADIKRLVEGDPETEKEADDE